MLYIDRHLVHEVTSPQAFEGLRLAAVRLDEPWAERELRLVARDFDALPVTARLLVEHLAPKISPSP